MNMNFINRCFKYDNLLVECKFAFDFNDFCCLVSKCNIIDFNKIFIVVFGVISGIFNILILVFIFGGLILVLKFYSKYERKKLNLLFIFFLFLSLEYGVYSFFY